MMMPSAPWSPNGNDRNEVLACLWQRYMMHILHEVGLTYHALHYCLKLEQFHLQRSLGIIANLQIYIYIYTCVDMYIHMPVYMHAEV